MNEELTEGRAEKGQGSKAGREKYSSGKGTGSKSVKSRKSRVRIFPTIKGALKSAAPYGTMFSTRSADRLYVISRKKWGTDKESQVGVRIAKGFTPGSATPNASWPSIKSHSIRTSIRHGGVSSSRLKKKYGAGEHRPEEKRYQGKPSIKKANEEVNPWAACNVSVGTKKTSKRERCIMHIKRKQGMKERTSSQNIFIRKLKVTLERKLSKK